MTHPKTAFEKALHKAISDALNRLASEHGVRVTEVQAQWFLAQPALEAHGYVVRSLVSTQVSEDYGGGPWALKTTQAFPVGLGNDGEPKNLSR